jgi:hypothetical protein
VIAAVAVMLIFVDARLLLAELRCARARPGTLVGNDAHDQDPDRGATAPRSIG